MASHRAQAQFTRSRWRLAILVPSWILQLVLTLTLVGLFAYRLSDSMIHYEQRDKLKGLWPVMEIVWECANIALSAVSIACTGFEIARYIGESLTPWIMVFTHVTKLCCAGAILALGILIHVKRIDKLYSIIGLGLAGALLATAIVLATYVFFAYRRLVTFDDHPHTANAKSYGFSDGLDRRSSYQAMLGNIRPSMEKRVSSTSTYLSLRRASEGPTDGIVNDSTNGNGNGNVNTLTDFEQLPGPYSHQRDTQFESYVVQRRSSQSGAPTDLEMALRNPELDWDWHRSGKKPAPKYRGLGGISEDDTTTTTTPQGGYSDRDRLVTVGSIMSRPRGASMGRASSWQSDHGLVSVPEEEDGTGRHDPRTAEQRDRQALLGHGRSASEDQHHHHNASQEADIGVPRWQR